MKTTPSKAGRYPEIIGDIIAVATNLVAEGNCTLSLATISKIANIPTETVRASFPTIDKLIDTLYLDLCRKKNAAIPAHYHPNRFLNDRARSIWQGYVA